MPSNNLHHSPPTTHHAPLEQLRTIMARLRDPQGGCPWDLEQNFATIAPYTIEEAYEVADAIARGDMGELKDELGDLLLQVVFHSQMATEAGLFTFDDVAQAVSDKMIRRHPHVFADAEIKTAQAQTVSWESIKSAERSAKKQTERTLDNIPAALPALMRAQKLQSRAARVGFDWPEVSGVIAKIREELLEVEQAMLAHSFCHPEQSEGSPAEKDPSASPQDDKKTHDHVAEEIGDLLFAVTNLARFTGHDAESALRGTNAKFTRRFEYIEDQLRAAGKTPGDSTLGEMGTLWDAAKGLEKTS